MTVAKQLLCQHLPLPSVCDLRFPGRLCGLVDAIRTVTASMFPPLRLVPALVAVCACIVAAHADTASSAWDVPGGNPAQTAMSQNPISTTGNIQWAISAGSSVPNGAVVNRFGDRVYVATADQNVVALEVPGDVGHGISVGFGVANAKVVWTYSLGVLPSTGPSLSPDEELLFVGYVRVPLPACGHLSLGICHTELPIRGSSLSTPTLARQNGRPSRWQAQ